MKELRNEKLQIFEAELNDGRVLEVQKEYEFMEPQLGNTVSVDAEPVEDGIYQLAKKQKYFDIRKGKIFKILTEKKYTNPDGEDIFIQQQVNWEISYGDYVYMHGQKVETSKINFTNTKLLVVRDGKVVRLERKDPFTRWLSKVWKSTWGYYYE